MRLTAGASPCRTYTGHVCSVEHAAVVESYRERRQVYEECLEDVAMGYATEGAEYRRGHSVTFRAHLVSWRGAAA